MKLSKVAASSGDPQSSQERLCHCSVQGESSWSENDSYGAGREYRNLFTPQCDCACNERADVFAERGRYFYSGRLDIVSVHQAACTRTAAAKYRVPELEKMCLCFMNSCMKLDEVCPFLDYVLTMGEQDMATCASALICKDSLGVLYSPTFPYSTEDTVRFILCHATNVAEASVVRAMFIWAQLQWLKRFEDSEDCSVRSIMLPLFPELRFLMLTASELVEGPIAWKIFTDAEALAILSNVVKEGSMPMPKGFCQIRKPRT
ncbi:hypothetical protein HPB50_008929 [Hyalomma asiaticum]|uniref:Uncharacterized protein n=1 Tax=Hyalomma asiaticum TaxID=266040 RepID=A0ACB7TEP8_HYAAI|nr:hypothetical protein HPB50_008929 [Hyalomma asiaticum]